MKSQTLGQLMKIYESFETTRKLIPLLPVYVRLDGRSFHTFTQSFDRPYDSRLMNAMIETTKHLVKETHAKIGYTQSDEISLIYYNDNEEEYPLFNGKYFKLYSVLASMAAAKFNIIGMTEFPMETIKYTPAFDCRIVQFPTKKLCIKMLYWRYRDAVKNSVSMLAQTAFSDKILHEKNTAYRLKMLEDNGIDWNKYPSGFKYGTFLRREVVSMLLTEEELQKIPEKHRPVGEVVRSTINKIDMSDFKNILNIEAVVFDGADPIGTNPADYGLEHIY